jgi:hypothetical protein
MQYKKSFKNILYKKIFLVLLKYSKNNIIAFKQIKALNGSSKYTFIFRESMVGENRQ